MSQDASLHFELAALPDDPAFLKRLFVEREQQLLTQHQALIAQLKEATAQHNALIAQLKAGAAQHATVVAQIKAEAVRQLAAERERHAAELKAAIAALLRRYYGPRSESFDPRQLLLFGQLVEQLPLDEASITEEAGEQLVTRRVQNRHHHGRQTLPECLERIEIEHDLQPEEKACPACGCQRCRIGAEISEQLEYFPANFKVLKHTRHKYACGRCSADGYNPNIAAAAKPAQPIDKGLPGPSLLAYVITSKLGDHLPLYRLENIFARQQVQVARSTMCAWMAAAGELVKPLVVLMASRVKQSRVIHTDDTTVPVQSPGAVLSGGRPGKQSAPKQCRQGRIWCYLGDEANPYTVYDYTPNRKRDGPARWLRGYSGYLQADAYGGYDGLYHAPGAASNATPSAASNATPSAASNATPGAASNATPGAASNATPGAASNATPGAASNATPGAASNATPGVVEVACWAHARRKFFDAQDSDGKRAAQMLALIGELYAVEREAKEQSLDEASRLALRQQRSVPLLEKIKTWLDTEAQVVLSRSPLAAAITYARNQWTALTTYTTQGCLNIDNNASERALKRVAIGRKNWLFAGTDAAAANHARLWSLIASAERHGLDPQRYLSSVLAKLGQLPRDTGGQTPAAELAHFLPDVWKRDDAAEPLPAAQ